MNINESEYLFDSEWINKIDNNNENNNEDNNIRFNQGVIRFDDDWDYNIRNIGEEEAEFIKSIDDKMFENTIIDDDMRRIIEIEDMEERQREIDYLEEYYKLRDNCVDLPKHIKNKY